IPEEIDDNEEDNDTDDSEETDEDIGDSEEAGEDIEEVVDGDNTNRKHKLPTSDIQRRYKRIRTTTKSQNKAKKYGIDLDTVRANPSIVTLKRIVGEINKQLPLGASKLRKSLKKQDLLESLFDFFSVPMDERWENIGTSKHRRHEYVLKFNSLDRGYAEAKKWFERGSDKSNSDCECERCEGKPWTSSSIGSVITLPSVDMRPRVPAIKNIEDAIMQVEDGTIQALRDKWYKTKNWKRIRNKVLEREKLFREYKIYGGLPGLYAEYFDETETITYKRLISKIENRNAIMVIPNDATNSKPINGKIDYGHYAAMEQENDITAGTQKVYNSTWNGYYRFQCQRYKHFYNKEFDPTIVTEMTPKDICAYIYKQCEPRDTADKHGSPIGCLGHSISTALAIQSAITRYYNINGRRKAIFEYDETQQKWVGNPTQSEDVRRYIRSLRQRKARRGEAAESVRALTPNDMDELYTYCQQEGVIGARQYCAYMFAYLCLLRGDEVLNIQWTHIEFRKRYITLTLNFRKTAQSGGRLSLRMSESSPLYYGAIIIISIFALYEHI
ncbi:hypothetical protein BC938DRAFT_473715, partial [Jimgerdemannia flammicorona]